MAKWPYSTAHWQRLRLAKLARTPLCEYCPHGALAVATQVDHRIAINDGGHPWAWDNLVSACASCHSRKTMAVDVRQRIDRVPHGPDPLTGKPRSAQHWWNGDEEKSLRADNAGPPPRKSNSELVAGAKRNGS